MVTDIEQKAWDLCKNLIRFSPLFLARKLKITVPFAQKLCTQIRLRLRNEARQMAFQLENYGFPSQLQECSKRLNSNRLNKRNKKDR